MSTKDRPDRVELLQGTLDLLVLRSLVLSPLHGHAIAKAIERNSEDDFCRTRVSLSCASPTYQARLDHGGRWDFGEQ